MFPLKLRKIGGYLFGQGTFYGTKHTGTDYAARYVDYYAPFDGDSIAGVTAGGGNFWQLTRPNGDVLIARHLNKIHKTGKVRMGELVAQTGNTGQYTTNAHLHQEVKINGKLTNPELYNWEAPMTLKIQLVFNNQKYGREADALANAKNRLKALSDGKIEVEWYKPIYTEYKDIPTLVYMDTFSGETDSAIKHEWFLDNVYKLNTEADVVVFVGKKGDWQYQANGRDTYGHYYSTYPHTYPALIQIVAGESDWSWKWPALTAFNHYLTHEVTHSLAQAQGVDKTHEYDYKSINGLGEYLPYLDYNKINYALTHQVGYLRNYMVYKKQGNATIYIAVGDVLIPVTSYEAFLADLKNAVVIELSPNEFLKFKQANKLIVGKR